MKFVEISVAAFRSKIFFSPLISENLSVIGDCITALPDSQIKPLSSNEFLFSDKAQALRDVGTVVNAT